MEAFFFILAFTAIFYWCRSWHTKLHGKEKLVFWGGLALKVMAGLVLGAVYVFYYGEGDTLSLTHDARLILKEMWDVSVYPYFRFLFLGDTYQRPDLLPEGLYDPSPRALFMAKTISVALLFSFRNYWLCSLLFSFVAFSALWKLYHRLASTFKELQQPIATALFVVPSFAFFSSGVSKESLLIFCLCHLWEKAFLLFEAKKPPLQTLLWIPFLLWVLLKLKYYYFASFACALGAVYISYRLSRKFPKAFIPLLFLLASGTFFIGGYIHPNLKADKLMTAIVLNQERIIANSRSGAFVMFEGLEPEAVSFFKNSPEALFSGLARPLLGEGDSWPVFLLGAENTVLFLGLCLFLALYLKLKQIHNPLFIAVVVYLLPLMLFIPLSAPNFGTMMRYKAGYLPFLWVAACIGYQRLYQKIRKA